MVEPLKMKNIQISDLKDVTVSVSAKQKGYGRRFTVALGGSAKDVVFKDLYSKAQKLLNDLNHLTPEELKDLSTFIVKLKEAEVEGKDYYKAQGAGYKFRTVFHRVLGGAFRGSHTERLSKLQNKINDQAKGEFSAFIKNSHQALSGEVVIPIGDKSYHVKKELQADGFKLSIWEEGNPNAMTHIEKDASSEVKYQNFDAIADDAAAIFYEIDRYIVYESVLKNVFDDPEVLLETAILISRYSRNGLGGYNVWMDGDILKVQKKIHQGTDQGVLQVDKRDGSIKLGNDEAIAKEVGKRLFESVAFMAYTSSSSYANNTQYERLEITINRESLSRIPEWHLNQFMSLPRANGLKVTYQGEPGSDAGGLKREYIGKLASSISSRKTLFADVDGALKIPRLMRDQGDAVLACEKHEKEIYHNFGKMFQLCHASKRNLKDYDDNERELITTGRLFSDAVFKAAFSLSQHDLEKPFIDQKDSQIRMAKIILTHLDKKSSNTIDNVIKCFELLEGNALDDRDDVITLAFYMLSESVREGYEDENGPDIEKIKANKDQFKNDLFNALMTDSSTVDELNGAPLGSILDPIYHIAAGMRENVPDWDATRTGAVDEFSNKVQGSIDRDLIISNIQYKYQNDVINQKIIWLKEWIKDASDAEVQSFLKYVTGSASLPELTKITITEPGLLGGPFIGSSTCSMEIYMSSTMTYPRDRWGEATWDNTKEAFIRNLKSTISVEGFQKS